VAVNVSEKALAEIRSAVVARLPAGSGVSTCDALCAWIGNTVRSSCMRVWLNYRGLVEGLPATCLGNASGLQDYLPARTTGRCDALDLSIATRDLGNNFRYADTQLPEQADSVLFLPEVQYFPRFGAELRASLPPVSWRTPDAAGVHRLFCALPGQYVMTHFVQGERAATALQSAWLALGQLARVWRI